MNPDPLTMVRLTESGAFDTAYYVASYRREIPEGLSAVAHFLTEGLDRGMKPSDQFDPVLAKLARPGVDRAGIIDLAIQGMKTPAPLEILPEITPLPAYRPARTFRHESAANVAAADSFGAAEVKPFEAAGRPYQLQAPEAETMLGRLRADRPFAFVRLSHGDWDAIYAYDHIRQQVEAHPAAAPLTGEERDRLAQRICDALYHEQQMYFENYLFEVMSEMKGHSPSADFLYGISFKGFPTADARLFPWSKDDALHPSDRERLRLFSDDFHPAETLYDATLWKRWLIAGTLADLPRLMANRPVIAMVADRLSDLGDRWSLPWCLTVPMPPEHAGLDRYALLDACRARIAEAKALQRRHDTQSPVFLLQGSSFAYWFAAELFRSDPDLFYLDLGQVLHAWFWDHPEVPRLHWERLYGPSILRNMRLEAFYRARGTFGAVAERLGLETT